LRLIISGDGAQRDHLASRILSECRPVVTLLPLQSEEHYCEMMADADVTVITQQRARGDLFPQQASEQPLVRQSSPGGGGFLKRPAAAVEEGGFGVRVGPDAPEAVARAIESLAENPLQLNLLAKAGRRFVEQYEWNLVLERFVEQLHRVINTNSGS